MKFICWKCEMLCDLTANGAIQAMSIEDNLDTDPVPIDAFSCVQCFMDYLLRSRGETIEDNNNNGEN